MHKLLVIALNLFRNFFLLDLVLVERFDIIIELLTHETILFQNLDVVDNLLLDASDSPELVSFIVFAVQEFLTVWNCAWLFHHYLLLAQDNLVKHDQPSHRAPAPRRGLPPPVRGPHFQQPGQDLRRLYDSKALSALPARHYIRRAMFSESQ